MDESPRTKLFAVTGNPILHSRSPLLFNAVFDRYSLNAAYFSLAADSAQEALAMFREIGLSGMNVTAPFKTDLAALVDTLDEAAVIVGAVNTVVKVGSKLKGYNTDSDGVMGALRRRGVAISGRECVVLGAGGAGRAAAFGLIRAKASVTLVNRSARKAIEAAARLGCASAPLDALPSLLRSAHVLVSALPPGIEVVRGEWLPKGIVLMDANYAGASLAAMARETGHTYIDGEEWLLNQALPAILRFGGVRPPFQRLREILRSHIPPEGKASNISLIGFMGGGKSTVGRKLAARMGFSFCDTDELIEERAGRSVADIFREEGEASFRKRERESLTELKKSRRTVFACGGGAVLDPRNRNILRENSIVVWLHASVETCLRRIKRESRPLLDSGSRDTKARGLFDERLAAYARAADLAVSGEMTSGQVARKIDDEINRTFRH